MKNIVLIIATLAALMMSGCVRDNQEEQGADRTRLVEVAFLRGAVGTKASTKATGEALATNTTFRVLVHEVDADIASATAVSERTYRITSPAGSTTTAAVKADGQYDPDGTPDPEMTLKSRNYDFYYFAPAIAVTNGKATALSNGVDYMIHKETYDVKSNNADFRFHVAEVMLQRLCTRLDIRIAPQPGNTVITTLEMDPLGATIAGLGVSGQYDFSAAATGITVTGNTGELTLAESDFTAETGATPKLTTESGKGAIILPITPAREILMTVNVKVNGKPFAVKAKIDNTQTLEVGKKYLVNIQIDQFGKVGLTGVKVTAAPWETSNIAEPGGIVPVIGEYRAGGVVYWVDPTDEESYSVVSLYEPKNMNLADAKLYDYGAKWLLPNATQAAELASQYAANKAVIDQALTTYMGDPIADQNYWMHTTNATNSINLTTGALATVDVATPQALRVIKEVRPPSPPANCYVGYPKGGVYLPIMFNALKKPIAKYAAGNATPVNIKGANPSTASGDAGLENDIVYTSGDVIEVSWQTAVNHGTVGGAANMVIKSAALGADGTAKVEVNGPGNAVLSYKRGGVILWNYHIWVTDTNPFVNHAINAGGDVNGKAEGGAQAGFMDRNLGALAATTAKPTAALAYKYFGVLYQHGRPTPFSGQGVGTTVDAYTAIYDKAGAAISSSIGGYTQSNTAVSSVTDAIKTPNTYYYSNAPGGWTWYGFADISLWSDYGTNKSIYDPCPYGYRVPKSGDGTSSSWYGFKATAWGSTSIDGGTLWNSTWWPAAGYRADDSGGSSNVGYVGWYWSSKLTNSYPYQSGHLYFRYDNVTYTIIGNDRSAGMSVRCVQEGY